MSAPSLPAVVSAVWIGVGIGCANAGADRSGYSVRDSAGIQVVESVTPAWTADAAWRVSTDPILTIGMVDGPPEYQLFRVGAALKLEDGRIVISNGGYELRFFDSGGTYLHSSGREGGGPGEFRFMASVWRTIADSLVIFDLSLRRVSLLDASGVFGRSFQLTQPSFPRGLLGTQWMYARLLARDGSDDIRPGFRRDTTLIVRVDLEGELQDTLGAFPGSERYAEMIGQERGIVLSVPFGLRGEMASSRTRFYYGFGETYEIEVYSPAGVLERLIRRPIPNRPVTDDDIEYSRRPRGNAAPSVPNVVDRMRDEVPIPNTMPAYGSFMVDAGENLWVGEYRARRDQQPRWTVFDPQGRMLGTIEAPADGRVTEIGNDYLLGVWTDELDVEQVRMYRLVKEGG